MESLAKRLIRVRPSERQLRWQQMEWIAFFHFGINTFTDREWGTGTEDPALFNPLDVDTDQWCRAVKHAGIRGCILTAKHHDGFCLWDTKMTRHSVMHSPFGRDVVSLLTKSCERYGLKLGLYLSPWDRHEPTYGTGDAYNDFFCAQLQELLTGYGPLFELWFDGACGEGENGKIQTYDWQRIYSLIRKHQPLACISVCGPDVRWCGNEAGEWRESEWSVVPASLRDCEKIRAASQQSDDVGFRTRGISSEDRDLGSRRVMEDAKEWVWYPSEVNTSIRPGWFYHASEDAQVKPASTLLHLYEHTAGGNAVFLLNIPPTSDGRIHEKDEAILREAGDRLRSRFGNNFACFATAHADDEAPGHEAASVLLDDDTYWKPRDGRESAELRIELSNVVTISRVVFGEQIQKGQRIERFQLLAIVDGEEKLIYEGATVGYKKICTVSLARTDTLVLRVLESRVAPTVRHFSVF